MAARKPQTAPEPDPPALDQISTGPEPDIDDEMPLADKIRSMVGGASADGLRGILYRVRPGEKDLVLGEVDVKDFDPLSVQRQAGEGTYRIRVYGPLGNGKSGLHVNEVFEVGPPLGNVKQNDAAPVNLREEIRAAVRDLVPAVAAPAVPAKDPLEVALTLLDKFHKMMPPAQAAPQVSQLDYIRTMREMREFGMELAGNGPAPKEDSTNAMIAGGLGLLTQLLARREQGLPPPQTSQTIDAAQPGPTRQDIDQYQRHDVGPGIDPEPERGGDMDMMVKMAAGQLISAAEQNYPVKDVADQMERFLSEDLILGVIEPENWFELLTAIAPGAQNHKTYFESLRAEILSRYIADNATGGNREEPVGTPSDAGTGRKPSS